MTWGLVMDFAAPAQVYDAMHARLLDVTGGKGEGLLVHLARATETGFQIVEVWESKDRFERYQAELIGPLLAEMTGDGPPGEAPVATEFDVRGLVVPSAGIAV
jgi:CO dehydrogenase/acetyl-CoA synthase beta subunit